MFKKCFYLACAAVISCSSFALAETATIRSGEVWKEADGKVVNAHCGGLLQVGDVFYWFGEVRSPGNRFVQNVSCYRSTDLTNWTFRNMVVKPETDPIVVRSHLERPKVVYNAKTKKYVMWMHKEDARRGYAEAHCAVAVCDTPDGDYKWVGDFRPCDNMSRDCTLFQDDDGSAYFISSARENADMIIYKLSDDYLKVDKQVAVWFPGQYREAPAVFKKDGTYYLITSFCTGISPNPQYYSTSKSLAGPWTPYKLLTGDDTWNTYYSQANYVLPIHGTEATTFIYCGDNWIARPMRQVWLPLELDGKGDLRMRWADRWQVDLKTGKTTMPPQATPLPNNLAKGKKTSASYDSPGRTVALHHFAGGEPSAAVDGDDKTAWVATDNLLGHWLKIDLGAVKEVDELRLAWRRKGSYQYKIEASADGKMWAPVVEKKSDDKDVEQDSFKIKPLKTQHFRVVFGEPENAYLWPSVVEFVALDGGENVTKGATAAADVYAKNTDAQKATDGDFSTAWTVDVRETPQWLSVDLGEVKRVGGCRILWEAPGYFYQYKIDVSADGSTWKTVVDKSSNKEIDRMPSHSFDAEARYVRLTLVGYERHCWPGIREFEVTPK